MYEYHLTLSLADRKAIDFVGHRYWHGDDFFRLLTLECDNDSDSDCGRGWCDNCDITYDIPEHVAWEIADNIMEDGLACFGPELVDKITKLLDKLV